MKFYLSFLCFIVFLNACQLETKTWQPSRELSFAIKKSSGAKFTGSHTDRDTQRESIYFADVKGKKQLYFFDAQAKVEDTISLLQLHQSLGGIDALNLWSKDTIFGFSKATNKVAAINRQGVLLKSLSLDSLYHKEQGTKYEFSYTGLANQYLNPDNILIGCAWLEDSLQNQMEDAYTQVRYFYEKDYACPKMVQLKGFFSATPKLKFGIQDFYAKITDAAHAFIESSNFKQLDGDRMIYYSVYSNKIFMFNEALEQLQVENLQSEFTEIGLAPIALTREELGQLQDLTDYNYHNRGFIRNVFYHQDLKKIVMLILHATQGAAKSYQDPQRPFSLLVLDEKLQKLEEFVFDDGQYEGANSFMTREGIYLKKISKNLVDHEKTYAIFKLD